MVDREQIGRGASLRRWLCFAAPLALGAAVLLLSWHWHADQARLAADWRQRAVRCVAMGDQIRALRTQPRRFEDRVLESHTVAALIERAAAQAGMQLNQITAIRPEPPQRVRDSHYVETFIRVRLTGISMEQLSRLLFHLQRSVPGLAIPQARVWAPAADAQAWEAEVTLVGLAYIPAEEAA